MAIHPPQQLRAQESWTRVLDSGARILAEQGIEGFSIAAVSEQSAVSVGSIYARVDGVDDLFEAIHEHVMKQLDEGSEIIARISSRNDLKVAEHLELVVGTTIEQWQKYRGELSAFILRAAVNKNIRELGASHLMNLERAFVSAMSPRMGDIPHADPETAVVTTFRLLVDSLGWDSAFGNNFGSIDNRDIDFIIRLQRICLLYLLTPAGN